MTREEFIERQEKALDWLFSFTQGEDSSRRRFEQLAIDTYDFLGSQGAQVFLCFSAWPDSAGNLLNQKYPNLQIPPWLQQRWEEWKAEYSEVATRNPRLGLRDMMQDISESHDASSWPAGYEGRIQDWVDAGDAAAKPPFDDRRRIVTADFYQRLCDLRHRCGGWLYWNDQLRRVVFAPEPEWQQIRTAQESARAERWKPLQEALARADRLAERLATVMAAARNDDVFWDALKSWELAREAKRPAVVPKLQPMALSGPMAVPAEHQRIIQASPGWRNQFDNPPVDAIFADFIARVRVPDDAATAGEIVFQLRIAVRSELGLDGVLQWEGGPGIGQADT